VLNGRKETNSGEFGAVEILEKKGTDKKKRRWKKRTCRKRAKRLRYRMVASKARVRRYQKSVNGRGRGGVGV
jgi:hypothetical protein